MTAHDAPAVPRAPVAPSSLVIMGSPVAQSLSPVFQEAALRHASLPVPYTRLDVSVERLDEVLDDLRRSCTGGNVTMPLKEAMFARARHTTLAARHTQAVNTFWWNGNELVGHNTDVDGVEATVTALGADGVQGDVLVLGAGGAAAAVLEALARTPATREARVQVASRSRARAERLAAATLHPAKVVSLEAVRWPQVGLVVNATPVGMRDGDPPPVAVEQLAPHTLVFDLVYRRDGTAWVHAARARGLRAEDGLRMLVEQGAAAFTCWFGVAPAREVMWAALGVSAPAAHAPRA